MPLLRIYRQPNFQQVFIASEAISDLATIEISTVGARYVQQARDTNPERAVGVARGGVSSGQLVRAVVEGIVSGVICAAAVNAGDRLMIASGGKVTPLNTITPAGAVSGYAPINLISGGVGSGNVTVGIGALGNTSGILSGLGGVVFSSGLFAGTAFNTTRVMGKALTSAGVGSGLIMYVGMAG
jgi:hypothetical protein